MPTDVPFAGIPQLTHQPSQFTEASLHALTQRGLTAEFALAHGVIPVNGPEDLDAHVPGWRGSDGWWVLGAQGMLFPKRSPDDYADGRVTMYQLRPDVPIPGASGEPDDVTKYALPTGCGSVLNTLRPIGPDTRLVMVVEGTCQALAVLAYTDETIAVFGIDGCWNWRIPGGAGRITFPDLGEVDGHDVVLSFDADVTKKPQVHDAAKTLTQAVLAEGATSVRYLIAPGSGNVGIDDILAARKEERRARFLGNLIAQAPNTLGKRPAATAVRQAEAQAQVERLSSDPDRPMVVVNEDPNEVINKISKALTSKLSGGTLFNHGGIISELVDSDHMVPVVQARFDDLAVEHTTCVRRVTKGDADVYAPSWPESKTLAAASSRAREYAPLERVTRTPFIRPDGSACLVPGYDDATKTVLVLDEKLARPGALDVPEDPRPHLEKCVSFVQWWLTDILAKMPDAASRANYLGLLLTPLTRSFYDLAPLAVVNGLAPEVGKGMSMSLFSLATLGHPLKTMGWRDNDDENAKTIFAAFRGGIDTMIFDEAHRLFGKSFARALTSPTYSDRILGVSATAEFPNRVTWVAAGNKVVAEDTIERRTYPIHISPEGEWRSQDADSFTIPEIETWTAENRGQILSALLTMIRAWHVAGRPLASGDFSNFTGWQRTVGGILAVAGVEGFLGNRKEWRSSSSFDELHWEQHLAWFAETFGDRDVFTNEVTKTMVADRDAERPPGLESGLEDHGYPRLLGSAYTKQEGVPHGDYKLVSRMGHRKTKRWSVVRFGRPTIELGGPTPDTGGAPEGHTPGYQGIRPGNQTISDTQTGGSGGSPTTYAYGNTTFSVSRADTASVEGRQGGSLRSLHTGVSEANPQENGCVGPGGTSSEAGHTPMPVSPPATSAEANPQENGCVAPQERDTAVGVSQYERVDLATYVLDGAIELPEGVVVFDVETKGKLIWEPGTGYAPGFVRITGYQVGRTIRVSPDAVEIADVLREAKVVVGHNILGFDLIPFAMEHGLDLQTMADEGRIIDTMLSEVLLDPPQVEPGKDKIPVGQVIRQYGLDAVAKRRGVPGKTDDLKKLAKEFGGFDVIPVDEARYVSYCAGDVDATSQVAEKQELTPYIAREHRVAAAVAEMRRSGFRVDRELLAERASAARTVRQERIARLVDEYGVPLTDGKGVPFKAPHATKPGKAAIDAAFERHGIRLDRTAKSADPCLKVEYLREVQAQHAGNPQVVDLTQTIMELVGVRSVYETVENHLVVYPDGTARVHPDVLMFQASGRWSITNPGLTVFGKRGGRHVEREVFIADDGELMWCPDFSQLDARGVAAHCQDQAYLDNFEGDRDLHTEVAVAVFGEEVRGDKATRDRIKPITHGWNYGMGINKLAAQCGDMALAARYDQAMRAAYPDLVAWKAHMAEMAGVGNLLDNGYGRQLRCAPGRGVTQAPALVGQAWSADTMKEAVLRLPRAQRAMLRTSVHDELVFSIPEDRLEESQAVILDAMTMSWAPYAGARPVQIVVDGGPTAKSWGGCYA